MGSKYKQQYWHFLLIISILYALISVAFISNFNINVSGARLAPDFEVVDIKGNFYKLSNVSSKVILLDFFATWCSPCEKAILVFQDFYSIYTRNDLEIISISPEDNTTLFNYAQDPDVNMGWIVVSDYDGSIFDSYLGTAQSIPHLYLVDSDGYIRYDRLGWTDEYTTILKQEIDAILSGEVINGNDNPGQGQTLPTIIIIGAIIVVFLVGLFLAGQYLGWSKPSKKRRKKRLRVFNQLGD